MAKRTRRMWITMFAAAAGVGLHAAAIGQQALGSALMSPPGAPAPERPIETADDLLRALETADADLRTLQAGVKYLRNFGAIEGDEQQEWQGTLHYDGDLDRPGAAPRGEGARRGFAVVFDQNIVNGQRRNERRAYIFDGEWFVEKNIDEKQMIRRRVVPPGEVADPLRIGEGPFPIPIGQKREDILRRFTVELRPVGEGFENDAEPPILRGAHQLRLVPRAGTPEAREFREVRLWYRGADLLPRMARTVNVDGGRSEVMLIDHKRNQPTPDGVFDTAPPPRGAGWDVQTEEWRGTDDNVR